MTRQPRSACSGARPVGGGVALWGADAERMLGRWGSRCSNGVRMLLRLALALGGQGGSVVGGKWSVDVRCDGVGDGDGP